MKHLFLFISLLLAVFIQTANAQVPNSMKYQAVARNNDGSAIDKQNVHLKIQIHEATMNGDVVFAETHAVTTNSYGIVHLEIGNGNNILGALNELDWGVHDFFIEVQLDPDGGDDFQSMGTAQLLTVPYAFFAENGIHFNPDLECSADTEGRIRYNFESKTLEVCNGEEWVELGTSGGSGFNCGDPLIDDRDGQSYQTIKIGDQCWMAENLNYGTYVESNFTNEVHADVSNNGTVEKYALNNDEANLDLYGALYDWNEMMNYQSTEGSQGICPEGWHVPAHAEFVELVESVGGWLVAGKALKVGGASGFEFKMVGNRTSKGGFSVLGTASMWSSTISESHPDSRAWNVYFNENADNAAQATDVMVVGKSCRCIKN
jgi:uncharacterized protein (TIGR02145 family)